MFPETATYFDRLRAHLALDDSLEADIVRELEAHVEDSVECLVQDGVAEPCARRLVIDRLGRPQTFAHLIRQAYAVTGWREALFGAAPLLLMSALIGGRLWQEPALALVSCLIVVAVTLYGLAQGRPAWFYQWAGVALTLPLVAGYIAFAVLQREAPQLGAGRAEAWGILGAAGAALYFPVGLLVVASAVRVALRRDWLDASVLISPLPGILVWLIAVHRAGGLRSPDGSLAGTSVMLGLLYACMALAAVAFLRSRSRSTKVATILASAVLLVSIGTPIDSQAGFITVALRVVLLVAFLLSPALVVRRSWER